jgi:hypothetical protein
MSRHQETFLSTKEWMTIPWKFQPKTWRDRLYDLAISFSKVVVDYFRNDQVSSRQEKMETGIDKTLQIEKEISIWKSSWFSEEYSHLQLRCDCQSPAMFSCICSVPSSNLASNDFILLHVECWALQLQISNTLNKLLATESGFVPPWNGHLLVRSLQIVGSMQAASSFSALNPTIKRCSGVTESICRSIFPNWVLKEYWGIEHSNEGLPIG